MPENTLPDWVTSTPREHEYSMFAYCEYDGTLQEVELSRAEYIALKQHLAVLRGYATPAADAEFLQGVGVKA